MKSLLIYTNLEMKIYDFFFQKSQDTVSSFIYNKNQVQLDKLLWCHKYSKSFFKQTYNNIKGSKVL